MNKKTTIAVLFATLTLFSSPVFSQRQPTKVLILSGANNHNWKKTTPAIQEILQDASIKADITENTAEITSQQLSKYDVIVSNFNNFGKTKHIWPEKTKKAYLDFISNGGGHVMLHAGGSSFYDWPEYHKINASWGKKTSHGPIHEFPVKTISPHPICNGLKPFKTKDELWRNTKFPSGSKVLMSAFSSKASGGKDTNEPILTVSNYGKGRCVNYMLGHNSASMTNPNFKTILTRSVLWAAGNKKQPPSYKWQKTDKSIALTNNSKTVWQFNYGKETSKPFFHPVSLIDGTVLTVDRPKDHPWHHALWFSWKYINGVNFWEENRKTGKSNGITDWSNVKASTNKDNSAKITMDLTYSHQGKKPILSEKRIMDISAPDCKGVYYIDWTSIFTACSDTIVELNRTPNIGEPGGKAWGGYAGLSVRLNGEGKDWKVLTEKGPITFEKGTYRGKAESMEFSGIFENKPAGIAILDHPHNLNAPTPWYSIAGNPMKYYSPAVICFKPHTLKPGDLLILKYRVIVHPDRWNTENLKSELKKYKPVNGLKNGKVK